MDASSAILPQAQVEFFKAIDQSTLPDADYNSRITAAYQNAEKYVKQEKDVNELTKFKSRITQELSKLESHPDIVSKTHAVTTSIIQVQRENCQKMLELLDQKINQVATKTLGATTLIASTAVTSPSQTKMDAAVLRLKQNREKTEKIKEQIIRCIIDPGFQVNDILNFVENAYKSSPFKKEYAQAKEIIASGQVDTIPDGMDPKVFPILLSALARMEVLRKEIKGYADPETYKVHPKFIVIMAQMANALISFDLLAGKELRSEVYGPHKFAKKVLGELEAAGKRILTETKGKPLLENMEKEWLGTESQWHNAWRMYEHIYPIILCGNLGVYTFEASVFAFANKLALLGVAKSERGIHGGLYQEPLVLFSHDVLHHRDILTENAESRLAARFLNFSQSLYSVIKEKIPENEQEFFFWGAHMLLHETENPNYYSDFQVNQNPVLSEIFGMCWDNALGTFFKDVRLKSEFEPWEVKQRSLKEAKIFHLVRRDQAEAQKYSDLIKKLEQYRSDPSQKMENVVTSGTPDRVQYDVIEAMINLIYDPEKKRAMENRILPGLADYSTNLKTELQKRYQISDTTNKTSDEYKNYLKDLNSQLYGYKTQHYNAFEAFKAFRECMYEFKNRMIPFLQEIDKVKGPIGDANYKNVWEEGKAI